MGEVNDAVTGQAKPFGEGSFQVGLAAYDALWDLCDLRQQTKRIWTVTDRRSLQGHFNVEEHILDGYADPSLTPEQAISLEDVLTRYHVALPFDEAERNWLYETTGGVAWTDTLQLVRRSEAALVSNGLRRVIYGRDLLRRWWAWRRGADEFTGQGTVNLAGEALRELIETVSPNLGLPENYSRRRST